MSKTSRETNKPEIKAIIFDIGSVIIRLDPARAIAAIGRVDRNFHPIKCGRRCRKTLCGRPGRKGALSRKIGMRMLSRVFTRLFHSTNFCGAWNSILCPELILPESLFKQLSKKCRLLLLSNTDPIHVGCMESTFPFIRYFPERIYSCDVGASKPGLKIFRAAIRAAGVPANQILFIDDVRENVLAARRIGLKTHQFRSRRRLEADLKAMRVLP